MIVVGHKPHIRRCDIGPPASALSRIELPLATASLRLFRNTRSIRRLRRAIESLVAVSARHVPRPVG